MKFNVEDKLELKSDVLVLGLWDDDKELYSKENPELSSELSHAIKSGAFEREFGETFSTRITNSTYKSVLVISLGKKEVMTIERVRRLMVRIVKFLRTHKHSSFTTNITSMIDLEASRLGMACAEGLILSDYIFDKYKSKKENRHDITANFQYGDSSGFMEGFGMGRVIAKSTNYARDLVNEPAVVVTPEYIEEEARALEGANIRIKVLGKKELKEQGLNALLGVSAGSDHEPRLILIEYSGGLEDTKRDPYTAIAGKGITFDSGGYDIKPAGKFADMKCDMAGAAAVIGTIKAAKQLGIKKNILGVIATCENLINGSAQKPGDIVKAYNGKTIEIGNTDAEGRLILADAISYAEKNYSPSIIIDLATLTGACIVALGFYATALYSNDENLASSLKKAGDDSNDRVWQMPFFEDYWSLMDGDISDLKNISKWDDHRAAGSITAAVFLSKFVDLKKTSWAHLDIASTAFIPESHEYDPKYATGAGVRLLSYWLSSQ